MNYGQSQAVMVLAAERIGFPMANTAIAKKVLEGGALHPMFGAALEKEATEIHNRIRSHPELINQANAHCAELIAEYHLVETPQG